MSKKNTTAAAKKVTSFTADTTGAGLDVKKQI
jgi:hypothetical protein